MRRFATLLAASAIVVAAAPPAEAAPKIEHVVVIVLENGTFDNYFGTYPGAAGITRANDAQFDSRNRRVHAEPFTESELGNEGPFAVATGEEALSNSWRAALHAYSDGKMNHFVRAQGNRGREEAMVMKHYTRALQPALWELADENVLLDRYFSSVMGDSLPNLMHLIAGESYGIREGTKSILNRLWSSDIPTIFDRAEEAGIPWRYYVGGLGSIDRDKLLAGNYFTGTGSTPSQLYWAPVLSMERFWKPPMADGITHQETFFRDAAAGDLPAISYVLPSPNTHWPTKPAQSQARLLSFVNAIKKSPDWKTTAAFVVWDDWGGFFDHVPPPKKDAFGLGFRVPALLVSPYAKEGEIFHGTRDHTSIPNFIARTFDLQPVGKTHTSSSFDGALGETPSERNEIVSLARSDPYQAYGAPLGTEVFVFYLGGLALTALIAAGVALSSRGRQQPTENA